MFISDDEFNELFERFGYDYVEHDIDNFYEWLENYEPYIDYLNDKEDREDIAGIDRAYRENQARAIMEHK